jgi:hypothetical protein
MRLAFSAAWEWLQRSECELAFDLREKLACKIIEVVRQARPEVNELRNEALRSLGYMSENNNRRRPSVDSTNYAGTRADPIKQSTNASE